MPNDTPPPEVETPAGESAPPPNGKPPGAEARIAQLVAERNAIKAERDALQTAASTAAATAQELADTKAAREAERASWGEERDLLRTGLVDEEGQSVARLLYSRIPEADRPKSIGEWVGTLRAEGAKPPPALAPYLGIAGAPVYRAPPPAPAGTGRPAPAASPVTAEAQQAARQRWEAAGSPAKGPEADVMRALAAQAGVRRT